jgi:hypothetical protein
MERVAEKIYALRRSSTSRDRSAPVSEIFELQGVDEYERAERIYPTSAHTARNTIILVASRGTSLRPSPRIAQGHALGCGQTAGAAVGRRFQAR